MQDERCVEYAIKTLSFENCTHTLAIDGLSTLFAYQRYAEMEKSVRGLKDELKNKDRFKLFLVFSLANQGKTDEAEKLLYENGGLTVVDIREGEDSLDEAYLLVQRTKYPDKTFTYNDVSKQFRYKLKDM